MLDNLGKNGSMVLPLENCKVRIDEIRLLFTDAKGFITKRRKAIVSTPQRAVLDYK